MALRGQNRGALLLDARLRSVDVLRALATQATPPLSYLMYPNEAQQFNAVLRSGDHGQEKLRAMARGALVAIPRDRAEPANEKRMARATFLGAPAAFPLGQLSIAQLLECPRFLLFALKRRPDSYQICLESFGERILLDRKQRDLDLHAWLERRVRRPEATCLSTPPQWFNLYDFWPAEKASTQAAADGAVPGPWPTVMQETRPGRT